MGKNSEIHPDDLSAMRHSLAHILAYAVKDLYKDVKFGVGPVIENGFFYDFDLAKTISEDDLAKIEKRMKEIIGENHKFKREEINLDEAAKLVAEQGQPYKEELINYIKSQRSTKIDAKKGTGNESDKVSFYTIGSFTDLCRGGHMESTQDVGAFKLTKVSGAYWRGSEKNPQMQRVYGVAFETEKDLKKYLDRMEEAKKRDHRKLGQELDLFTFSDLVGPGLPLYTPKGTVIIEELKKALNELNQDYGMQQVSIPHLAKLKLYEISGHAEKFEEELFRVQSHYEQEFVLKPVNCPHHTQIYASKPRSYKDLPLRYVEQTMQYRDEKPGQLGGLQRVRGFTVDDGHTFCTIKQIEDEASSIAEIIKDFYTKLGLWGEHWVSLSIRDRQTSSAYIGEPSDWDKAEKMLSDVADKHKLGAKTMEGEAAIYGPKLDFMFKDALGRETQLATIQLDFAMPKRFGLTYIDNDGKEKTPAIIHRAILGSFERFIMLLIEHFGGKFPIWLAPEQIRIATVNQDDKITRFASSVLKQAEELGLRATVDDSNESVGKKIRSAEVLKIPYIVVVGEKEAKAKKLFPRVRGDLRAESKGAAINTEKFLKAAANEAKTRASKTSL